MLKQGSIGEIRSGKLTHAQGYLLVSMCFYPRGIKKTLIDEYRSDLAPDRELFREWKEHEAKHGHDEAFRLSNYEARFRLKPEAISHLKTLSGWSHERSIYLICQCELGGRCHREMLMLAAEKLFGARTAPIHHRYPTFLKRLRKKDFIWEGANL